MHVEDQMCHYDDKKYMAVLGYLEPKNFWRKYKSFNAFRKNDARCQVIDKLASSNGYVASCSYSWLHGVEKFAIKVFFVHETYTTFMFPRIPTHIYEETPNIFGYFNFDDYVKIACDATIKDNDGFALPFFPNTSYEQLMIDIDLQCCHQNDDMSA